MEVKSKISVIIFCQKSVKWHFSPKICFIRLYFLSLMYVYIFKILK